MLASRRHPVGRGGDNQDSAGLAVVVLLRVVAVYLPPRLPDLLDDKEVVFGLDDSFDAWLFMSRDDDEAVALLHDRRVAGGRNLDRVDTTDSTALAVEGQASRDVVLLCARFDPFVHVAEDFLIACRSFSEIIVGILYFSEN